MSIKDYIVKTFLVSYLKGLLDKLPFNGWKSVIGILLIVLGEMLKVLPPQYAGPLSLVMSVLQQLPSDPVTDMGIVTLIVGCVHKVLKALHVEA